MEKAIQDFKDKIFSEACKSLPCNLDSLKEGKELGVCLSLFGLINCSDEEKRIMVQHTEPVVLNEALSKTPLLFLFRKKETSCLISLARRASSFERDALQDVATNAR